MKLNVKMEKSCGAVIWREQESLPHVLVLQHQNGGHWAFPKGHVEGKETEEQTALREIMEETGLKVKLDPGFRRVVTFSPKPGVMKDVVYFAARPIGGKLKKQDAEPITPEEMAGLLYFSAKGVLLDYQEGTAVFLQIK